MAVLHQILSDEWEHRAFFRDALLLIRKHAADEQVEEAVRRVADLPSAGRFGPALLGDLGLGESSAPA